MAWPLLAASLLALRQAEEIPPIRRVAVRLAPQLREEFERFTAGAQRRGIRLEVGGEAQAIAAGWEVLRVGVTPVSEGFASRLTRFPIAAQANGFSFDGRSYRSADDAIALSAQGPSAEVLLLGNSAAAARRLTGGILWGGPFPAGSYRVVSSALRKEGRFLGAGDRVRVDRGSDRDEIAERDRFFRDLPAEKSAGVTWRSAASSRAATARYRQIFERHAPSGAGPAALTVLVFPDTMTKARYTGSSRPADLSRDGAVLRLELDASAPAEPDLVSPALAAAAVATREPRLLDRPLLLMGEGARRHGRWWGRDVAGFAAFTRRAGVSPTVAELLAPGEELSPVLAVGTAAAWLHAGAGSREPSRWLELLAAPPGRLAPQLEEWSRRAASASVTAPARRALPPGFLRGVSYAMTNRLESSYASPRSHETLQRLARLSVNSISIMPFGFSRTASEPSISFLHLHPGGETDEATVLAVTHARRLGMSTMVKPQIWLGGGTFVGEIAMSGEVAWRSWFEDYRRFMIHNAVIAEAAGANMFCVGTELVKTEGREREWREVIAAVRLATGAPLLYASNWAAGAPRVPFWDALEAIGVDLYDPLSPDPSATDAALRAGARQICGPLAALARKHRKPVIFAEAGYPPVRSAWLTPHEEDMPRPYAPEDAARSITAVFAALENEPWWRGVYWWKVFSEGRPATSGSKDFNILGRPAERAIAAGYARIAARAAR